LQFAYISEIKFFATVNFIHIFLVENEHITINRQIAFFYRKSNVNKFMLEHKNKTHETKHQHKTL